MNGHDARAFQGVQSGVGAVVVVDVEDNDDVAASALAATDPAWQHEDVSHQLRAALAAPHTDVIDAVLRERGAAGEGLFRLAAAFGAMRAPAVPATSVNTPPVSLRTRTEVAVNARPHVFPAAERVPALLELLFQRLEAMFQHSSSAAIDVDIAAFSVWALTAIHPFDNANGRTSVAFAQLLLAQRWGLSTSPLSLPPDAHTRLAPLLMELDVAETDVSAIGQLRAADRVEGQLHGLRVEDLGTLPPLARAAVALRAAVVANVAAQVGLSAAPSSSSS